MKIEDEPPDPLEWTPAYVARRELGLDEPADAFTDAIRAALPASKMRAKNFDGLEYWNNEDIRRRHNEIDDAKRMIVAVYNEAFTNGLEEFVRDYNTENPNSMFRLEVRCSPSTPLPTPTGRPSELDTDRPRRRRKRRRRPTDLAAGGDPSPDPYG